MHPRTSAYRRKSQWGSRLYRTCRKNTTWMTRFAWRTISNARIDWELRAETIPRVSPRNLRRWTIRSPLRPHLRQALHPLAYRLHPSLTRHQAFPVMPHLALQLTMYPRVLRLMTCPQTYRLVTCHQTMRHQTMRHRVTRHCMTRKQASCPQTWASPPSQWIGYPPVRRRPRG
jgi:hypothetical protein